METIPQTFTTPLGKTVRVVMDKEGAPWFVAKDVCDALGILNTSRAVSALDTTERSNLQRMKGGFSRGGAPVNIISESGLYKLIMRSDKPQALAFQNWVTKEVLPAIRKDGAYVMGEEKVKAGEMSEDEFILKAMTMLKMKAERLTKELAAATTQKEHLAGIVEEHLVHLTIDEWRALNGQYFTKSTIGKLAQAMRKRLLELGLEVPYEERTFEHPDYPGRLIPTKVKVYPKPILDDVARSLGLDVNMQFDIVKRA